jgi:ribosomal protein S27E
VDNRPLLALAPRGVGTAFVESVSGYVCRSAANLLVPVPRLVWAVTGEYGAFRFTQAVNGAEAITRRIISAVGTWSGAEAIDCLGFTQPGLGLHLRKDFRRERAWCPLCLASQDTAYDQVSWGFHRVRCCPRDGALLRATCESCGRGHRVWDLWAHTQCCAHCGAALAKSTQARGEVDPQTAAVASVILWIQLGRPIEPRRIATWAREFRGRATLRSSGDRLGLTLWTFSNLARGAQRLQMETLVSLLVHGRTTLSELHHFRPVEVEPARTPSRSPALVDTDRLREAVVAELALPVRMRRTIVTLARDLGVHPVTLRRRCGETDRLVSERRDEVRRRLAA